MPAPIKRPRITKRGSAAYWSPDPITRARLIWAVALINGPEFACKATPSTLLRRAVECYVRHLEDILKRPIKLCSEQFAVTEANRGSSAHTALPTECQLEYAARQSPPISFTQAMANRQASEPTLMQKIQRDLDRWAREANTPSDNDNQGVDDDDAL